MLTRKQILGRIQLKIIIASVVLVLLPPFAPARVQAQLPGPMQFDPPRLVFETVTGDYGGIYNVMQDKDGFLWLGGINDTIKYNGYEAESICPERTSALFEWAVYALVG